MQIKLDNGEEINIYKYRPDNKSGAVFIGEISLEIEDGVRCYMSSSWDEEGVMIGSISGRGNIPSKDIEKIVKFFEQIEESIEMLGDPDMHFDDITDFEDDYDEVDSLFNDIKINEKGIRGFIKGSLGSDKGWDDIFLVLNELNKWEVHNKEPIKIKTQAIFKEPYYFIPSEWEATEVKLKLPAELYPSLDLKNIRWTDVKLRIEKL